MNEKTKFVAIGIVAVLVIAGGGILIFNSMGGGGNDDNTITVTDSLGRSVKVPKNVKTVVCQQAGTLRLVSYFGQSAVDKVVGIDKGDANKGIGTPENYKRATYRIAFPEIVSKAYVGDLDNSEAVRGTKADVVFASEEDSSKVDNFQTACGIPVVALNIMYEMNEKEMSKFEGVVRLVGKVLGMDSRANELMAGINGLVKELKVERSKIGASESKKAYIGGLFYYMKGGIYKTTGNYSAFELTGIVNVMPDKNGIPYDTDMENLKSANPDVIFFDCMNYGGYKTAYAKDKPNLASVNAVNQGKIYSTMFYKYYGTNWENQLINAFYLGSVVYPTHYTFSEQKADQILKVFYGDKLNYSQLVALQSPGVKHLSDW